MSEPDVVPPVNRCKRKRASGGLYGAAKKAPAKKVPVKKASAKKAPVR